RQQGEQRGMAFVDRPARGQAGGGGVQARTPAPQRAPRPGGRPPQGGGGAGQPAGVEVATAQAPADAGGPGGGRQPGDQQRQRDRQPHHPQVGGRLGDVPVGVLHV